MSRLMDLPCALCFLLLVPHTVIQGLTITPSEKEIIIPAGATIELMCEHEKPVEWSYESFEEESPSANVVTESEGNWAKLTIEGASYMNVKSYTCSSTSPTVEESIYVFVRDVDHLLVAEDEQNIISFYTSEDIVVPCKPSFPDVQVKLMKVADSEILDYDNKRGFTVRLHEAKHIECVGTLTTGYSTHSTSVMYEAEQMHQPEDIPTPDIELVGKGPNDHVVVGQNATLRCSVMTPPGVHHDFHWTKPKTVSQDDDRFVIDYSVRTKYPPNSNQPYNLATSNLFIQNVKKSDEGYYKCTVSAGDKEASLSYDFKVFDNSQAFLNITPVGSLTYTSRPGKPEVVLVANIAAHPIPEITWYGPDKHKIVPNEKYNITGDMESTHLIVYTPTTSDIGNYTLKAENKAGLQILNYMLHIEGEPLIEIPESPKAYLLKTKQNVTCYVIGYPKPKVEMSFRPCPIREKCQPQETALHAYESCQNPPVSCNYTATLTISHQGNLTCSAYNRLGKASYASFIHVTDIPDEFHVYNNSVGNGKISDMDSIELECGASKNSYMNDLVWKFKKYNENIPIVLEEEVLEEKDGIKIRKNETDLSYWSALSILHPRINQSGIYTCTGHYKKDHSISSISTIISVLPSLAPSFYGSTGNNSHHDISPGGLLTWYCNASGNPSPSYTWYKNDKLLAPTDIRNNGKVFIISSVQVADEGSYKCVASNKKGSASLVFNLKIKKKEGSIFQWIGIAVATIVILVCIAIVIYQRKRIKQEKKAREEVFPADLYFFREGNVEYIDPNLDIADQAEFLPYNQAWEFPIEKLKLGKQLGFGAFGVVMKAEATGLRNDEEKTIVAVKMVKKNSDVDLIKALASELKIMANLGQHVNVVNLLGACTRNIASRELLVIVEFCKFGNLHDFLLTHRDSFINQVNPGSGNLEIIPSDNSMGFPVGVSRSNSNYRGGSAYDTAGSNCATVTTDMTLLSTPIGEDGYLLNKELSQHYQGDFQQTENKTICTQDLLCWGFQIAKGMEYLASRKVLHGDLAARNVLLAENNVVKICDFGLAKSMYKKEIYTKAGNELLPIKWMSIEALEDRVFSTQSDIWAYGIVLWELFTLSRTPYPGVQPSDVLTLLRSGYRMEKPEYATEDVYNVMIECWNKSPMLRPSFTECAERLGNMLEESVKQHYMDLNNPYVEFNSNQPSGRDYLSILNPPTYVNCTSDHSEGNVGNDYTPMQLGQRYKDDREKDAVELRPMLPQPGQTNIFNPGYEGLGHMVACTN